MISADLLPYRRENNRAYAYKTLQYDVLSKLDPLRRHMMMGVAAQLDPLLRPMMNGVAAGYSFKTHVILVPTFLFRSAVVSDISSISIIGILTPKNT